ncbi:MAG: alkaline phosphatase family protein [Candidatus Omnitrophota bacterium]
MTDAWAYVDPGQGFVYAQNAPLIWSILIGFLFFLPFRFFYKFVKKFLWIFILSVALLFTGGILMNMMGKTKKKVILLGIDAMDAKMTQRLMKEGRLPHLASLARTGGFLPLKTTNPAESAVAWSSFITGLNPGGHGIFDFIMRDPKTYLPYLSLNEISNDSGLPKVMMRRKGQAFWTLLSRNKIQSSIYFCPNTFPPERLLGRMVSGMGVPDITGTMGKFTFYTSKPLLPEDRDSRGNIVPVILDQGVAQTALYGPKMISSGATVQAKVPLTIILSSDARSACLEFQKKQVCLQEGQWSSWQRIIFKIGLCRRTEGIVRFYLKAVERGLELYASPINFNPCRPVFPISYPKGEACRLAKQNGFFYTQGMPYDTWALTEGRLDEKVFLELTETIFEERKKILLEELKRFKNGLFFFYFEDLDAIQHMFWRTVDPRHPLHETGGPYSRTIEQYYEKMDGVVGELLKDLDEDTVLMVFSDHGFTSFRKSVHLNRWLLEHGYLFLEKGQNESKEFFEHVDWHKTKAYALGFGGIYLNRIGREYGGIVGESEAESIKQRIKDEMKQWKDPQDGSVIVEEVYPQEEIFTGPYASDAPDLFVGFKEGYRASWQTALGGVPSTLIEDNRKKWSGDHLVDPSFVDGVIFSNIILKSDRPSIIDIAPTVLEVFGISKPSEMEGNALATHDK